MVDYDYFLEKLREKYSVDDNNRYELSFWNKSYYKDKEITEFIEDFPEYFLKYNIHLYITHLTKIKGNINCNYLIIDDINTPDLTIEVNNSKNILILNSKINNLNIVNNINNLILLNVKEKDEKNIIIKNNHINNLEIINCDNSNILFDKENINNIEIKDYFNFYERLFIFKDCEVNYNINLKNVYLINIIKECKNVKIKGFNNVYVNLNNNLDYLELNCCNNIKFYQEDYIINNLCFSNDCKYTNSFKIENIKYYNINQLILKNFFTKEFNNNFNNIIIDNVFIKKFKSSIDCNINILNKFIVNNFIVTSNSKHIIIPNKSFYPKNLIFDNVDYINVPSNLITDNIVLQNCSNIKEFPYLNMKSLSIINCNFKYIVFPLFYTNLKELTIVFSSIDKLPYYLVSIETLKLKHCDNIKFIPKTYINLKKLSILYCDNIKSLPKTLINLNELEIDNFIISTSLKTSLKTFINLEHIIYKY